MGRRLLIVEDEAVLRKHLARLFTREGYEVATADSCAAARRLIRADRFDTALLDIQLPDGNGLELLAALDACQRPPRTVVMTAFSSPEHDAYARRLKVDGLLRKPLDLLHVIRTVGTDADHVAEPAPRPAHPNPNFSNR